VCNSCAIFQCSALLLMQIYHPCRMFSKLFRDCCCRFPIANVLSPSSLSIDWCLTHWNDQVQSFCLTQHWFDYIIFPHEDGHKTETCSSYWMKYSNQCCVRWKPWTWPSTCNRMQTTNFKIGMGTTYTDFASIFSGKVSWVGCKVIALKLNHFIWKLLWWVETGSGNSKYAEIGTTRKFFCGLVKNIIGNTIF
jgi:hypothetical protein